MNTPTIKIVLTLLSCCFFTGSAWAYGGGGGTSSACKKPTFSALSPVHLAAVATASAISFKASARTDPSTLSVTAKKLPVDITVTKNNSSYNVTGNLPADLQNTFARVVITAKSASGCVGEESWLVKITDEVPVE